MDASQNPDTFSLEFGIPKSQHSSDQYDGDTIVVAALPRRSDRLSRDGYKKCIIPTHPIKRERTTPWPSNHFRWICRDTARHRRARAILKDARVVYPIGQGCSTCNGRKSHCVLSTISPSCACCAALARKCDAKSRQRKTFRATVTAQSLDRIKAESQNNSADVKEITGEAPFIEIKSPHKTTRGLATSNSDLLEQNEESRAISNKAVAEMLSISDRPLKKHKHEDHHVAKQNDLQKYPGLVTVTNEFGQPCAAILSQNIQDETSERLGIHENTNQGEKVDNELLRAKSALRQAENSIKQLTTERDEARDAAVRIRREKELMSSERDKLSQRNERSSWFMNLVQVVQEHGIDTASYWARELEAKGVDLETIYGNFGAEEVNPASGFQGMLNNSKEMKNQRRSPPDLTESDGMVTANGLDVYKRGMLPEKKESEDCIQGLDHTLPFGTLVQDRELGQSYIMHAESIIELVGSDDSVSGEEDWCYL